MRNAIAATRTLLLIGIAAVPGVVTAQLNPTVKVLKRPAAPLPSECEEGLAPQEAQRVTPEERAEVRDTSRDMLPPPSSTLRSELENAVTAAQQNSRDAFRDALARAKSLLGSYPPGNERSAASDVVSVLDDVDTVWNYEFTSPTGGFFDTSSDLYRLATRYSGYEAYVRRQIITDHNGNRFYPSRETRDFLVAEAAARLPRLTGRALPSRPAVRTTPPLVTARPIERSTTRPATTTTTTTTTTTRHHRREKAEVRPRATTRRSSAASTSHRSTKHKPVTHEARATTTPHVTKRSTSSSTTVVEHPKPTPATPTAKTAVAPSPTPEPARTSSSSPSPSPSPSTTATFTTDTMSSAPPPTTTSSGAAATDTTASTGTTSSTESTASTASNPQTPQPAQSRSFFGPIILIVVGIGVLVMLWRASS